MSVRLLPAAQSELDEARSLGTPNKPQAWAIRFWWGFCAPSSSLNGMVERVIRTLKDQCMHRHQLETLQHACRVIGDLIGIYNNQRPHQALKMKTPAQTYEIFKLAA